MSLHKDNETIEPSLLDSVRSRCPDCEQPLSLESLHCRHCGFDGEFKHGIPSLTPAAGTRPTAGDEPDATGLEPDELRLLAERAETGSIREATTTVLEDHPARGDALSTIYDVNRESWTALVGGTITGRCLDVDAGFGRRAHVLSELADSVVAVDSNLEKLRVAATRTDYDGTERVLPLHTTEDRLPFGPNSFDTIVADFTGSSTGEMRTRLSRLSEYLTDDGTLVFTADGWSRRSGLTELLDADTTEAIPSGALTDGTPGTYRSMITAAGFDSASLYSLFPTADRPLFVFGVDNERAVDLLAEILLSDYGRFARMGKPLVSLANRTGLLDRLHPSVLAVCENGDADGGSLERSTTFDDPLLVPGRTRSVVLETDDDGLETVWKFPNRRAHAPFTERENAVLSSLQVSNEPIVETLPRGTDVETPCGEARVETPVAGEPLADDLSRNLRSYERVLRLGFDWLIEFQQAFRGPTVTRSPAEVRDDLSFAPTGIEPPPIDESVTTFFTPVHGDYLAGNIHVDGSDVTSVIDWEYGAFEASPIIDAGFLALNTAMRVFGGLEDGFRTVFCGDNEYARIMRSMIRGYCREVGIPVRTFELYLPSVYLHRLELDWRFDAVSTYTEKMESRSEIVEYVFENLSDVDLEATLSPR
ncbi:methyltransferase domain-containing protein [Natronolimnohabitans innermongolicus]|uniref:Transcriptional regulator n=1 Tax=Natronolimnohabitans innermongolicus JCM 12255 TaxID=1227499 RepID=L9WKS7_9EURY|nr:methyltransferase domain-containing protein [Natronolimnohabitans innermongolicus]ELY48958.1 transcriptional regulator [Natronolimnohabitans innermongolicus JCM 12255]